MISERDETHLVSVTIRPHKRSRQNRETVVTRSFLLFLLRNMSAFVTRVFIWDTETTGAIPLEDDIISLGGVLCTIDSNKFVSIDSFHSFVQTNKTIDAAAQAVHHIAKRDLDGAPTFPEMIRSLRVFLQGLQPEPHARLLLLAHNGTQFDDLILYANFVQHRMDFEEFLRDIRVYGFVDSLKYLRVLLKGCVYDQQPKDASTGRVSFALGHCYQTYCGDSLENAHNALADSEGLLKVLNSDCVSSKITLQNLFKNVVKLDKAVKWVKQKAGVAFQAKEEAMRQAPALPSGEGGAAHDSEWTDEPIFERQVCASDFRLCLNCMSFVGPVGHERCSAGNMGGSSMYG
jgi:DNA polymerase III epsilon subunit-like protein